MNQIVNYTLKILRKIYGKLFKTQALSKPKCVEDPEKVSQIIYNKLIGNKPCMIARFGGFELSTVVNYLNVKQTDRNYLKYIQGKKEQWWWNNKLLNHMQNNAGFFPPTQRKIEQFCELMLDDMKEVDILGSWLSNERYFEESTKAAKKVKLVLLEPYTAVLPWSRCLKGKKVLVVHPFAELIEKQYKNRNLLFTNSDVLPEFQLQTIKAVQSMGGVNQEFKDWFEALEYMKDEIDKREYDICLIGAGAYGFSLAAHVKRNGKKAIHLGGALQLLFGIKGNRWEAKDYAVKWELPKDTYLTLFNEHWVKPTGKLKPKAASKVENACYW
ncbi:hypothetical protein [Maribellus sediminis]|uniref:hypothetical protein n=1 Tax=Maribellus sediminis TaxID=2696285 RepID=UPI0014308BBC|nr:hypothetical protein [Maribellus sediminis]